MLHIINTRFQTEFIAFFQTSFSYHLTEFERAKKLEQPDV